jgi:hypothetical protein
VIPVAGPSGELVGYMFKSDLFGTTHIHLVVNAPGVKIGRLTATGFHHGP